MRHFGTWVCSWPSLLKDLQNSFPPISKRETSVQLAVYQIRGIISISIWARRIQLFFTKCFYISFNKLAAWNRLALDRIFIQNYWDKSLGFFLTLIEKEDGNWSVRAKPLIYQSTFNKLCGMIITPSRWTQ